MKRYYWDISQGQKEELLEKAKLGSGRSNLSSEVFDSSDRGKILNKHENNERERISVSLAEKLIEAAIPNFDIYKDPLDEDFLNDRYSHGDKEFVVLKEDFKKSLLHPYSNEKLAEVSGRSEPTCKEYRFREHKSIPLETYERIFEHSTEVLSGNEIEAPIVKTNIGSRNELISTAGYNDVKVFSMIENNLMNGNYNTKRFNNILEELKENLADETSSRTYKITDRDSPNLYHILTEGNVLEDSNFSKAYRIGVDEEYIDTLIEETEYIINYG